MFSQSPFTLRYSVSLPLTDLGCVESGLTLIIIAEDGWLNLKLSSRSSIATLGLIFNQNGRPTEPGLQACSCISTYDVDYCV